ncbi:glutamate-rich protein 2 [Platichthys flesus]|uniref:glutamate-rich protein 2 n=1 Tax=Platichthys flesus TaxID=8260 RepID=UPI002DB6AD8D|nr:glutamate-rich protein 2 [Platichthys flesus]
MKKRTVTDKPWSSPASTRPHSRQETEKTGSPSEDVQHTGDCVWKESGNITPRVEKGAVSAAEEEELEMKDWRNTQSSGPGEPGGRAHTPPLVEPLHTHEVKEEEGQREEDDAQDEDLAAPLGLKLKFLRAVVDRELPLAHKLCQLILIYEPDHPEASEFLSLIQKKLLEEQEEEESKEEDEEEDDLSDDDEDSSSSSSDDDDDDDDY